MEKLYSYIFDDVTQLTNNKKEPNGSTIVTILSEKLDERIFDKD